MVYQEARLDGIFSAIVGTAVGFVSSEVENEKAQRGAAEAEANASTNAYLARVAKDNAVPDESWKSSSLTMQKYGALAAVGVVLVIGFFVLRK